MSIRAADDGRVLGHVKFLKSGETPSGDFSCEDPNLPEIGITAPPVIYRRCCACVPDSSMIESDNPKIDVRALMERTRLEAGKALALGLPYQRNLGAGTVLPGITVLPPPPAPISIRPVNEKKERLDQILGEDRHLLDAVTSLVKNTAELSNRLRETSSALESQNRWLHVVSVHQTADSTWRKSASSILWQLEARFAEHAGIMEAVSSALRDEAKAREEAEERVQAQHERLDLFDNMLEAVRSALAGEASAREEVEERVQAQHERLDLFGNMLEAVRAALSGEARVRERMEERIEVHKSAMTLFQNLLSHLDERQVADSSYLKRELQLRVHDFARLSNEAGKVRRRKGKQDESVVAPNGDNNHAFDAFYLAFENKFRGTRADIKERVSVYLPLIKDAGLARRKNPLLDLGCGRGEWLELLREEGLAGHGVDLNEFMVAECAARKLVVTQADVLHHLGSLRSNSQGVITAFYLIEHFPFPSLMNFFAESLRVLRPGGICIFETPNPDNIQVGSNRFYSDPTHLRPLPKEFTKFAMATVGFTSLEILPHPDHGAFDLRWIASVERCNSGVLEV